MARYGISGFADLVTGAHCRYQRLQEFRVATQRPQRPLANGAAGLSGAVSSSSIIITAGFAEIAAGAATYGVRAGTTLRGGITGAMRTAHLADAYRLRAEVHGSDIPNHHLCMAISNTTYYESLVTSTVVSRESCVDANGLVHAPLTPGIALPPHLDYPKAVRQFAA